MMHQCGIIVILALALVSTLQISTAQDIRLFGGSGSYEGRVEVKVNGQWGTVCNDTWDMDDAKVVCRELGNRTATMFTTMYGEGPGPILYSNVTCSGDEYRLVDCPRVESSVDVCEHSQDAGVECGFKNDDVRLVGGSIPNEGRVEIYLNAPPWNGAWGRVCADSSWDQKESDVVCRTVGYPGGAESMSRAGSLGNATGFVFLVGLRCNGGEVNVAGCEDASFVMFQNCPTEEEDATVVCSTEPEVGPEQLSTGAIAGIGIGFGLVIVMCCIFSLNCKCTPFWKKREVDDTDVYQCNTASNADSKNYSTTSNLKSESENRNDSLSDIDPNMFVFAPKIPPAGFGGPSAADASATNGTLPNIEEANEPNGVAPVSEMKDDEKDESEVVDDVRLNVDEVVNDDKKENVTIDMQGVARFNKDNHDDELEENPTQNTDLNESESVSIEQQSGDHESHDQPHYQPRDQPRDELEASPDEGANNVAYDTRL